jgi:type III pantothenate kinase
MLLALDIGNTNVTVGVFDGETLSATWRLTTDPRRMPDEYGLTLLNLLPLKGVAVADISAVVICSVVPPLTTLFSELSESYFNVRPLVVGAGIRTGIKILYDNPRDVGADRIVDAAAAYHMYGGPLIVVDFGTATVFDAVSAQAEYLGGAIAPGLRLAAESLFTTTSMLRRVELVAPSSAIGRNTTHSMQSGLVLGNVDLVEGMVKRFKREMGDANTKVIGTGGLSPLIARETSIFDAVSVDLTLLGLRMIHEMNADGRSEGNYRPAG